MVEAHKILHIGVYFFFDVLLVERLFIFVDIRAIFATAWLLATVHRLIDLWMIQILDPVETCVLAEVVIDVDCTVDGYFLLRRKLLSWGPAIIFVSVILVATEVVGVLSGEVVAVALDGFECVDIDTIGLHI